MCRYLILFVFMLLAACRREEAAPAYPLDSAVVVNIREARIGDTKHIVFSCQTRKSYPCSNFFIRSTLQQGAGRVRIDFLGVGAERLCTTAMGPARVDLDLGALADGQYTVTFNHQGAREGTLTVSAAAIELALPPSGGIEIVNPVVKR